MNRIVKPLLAISAPAACAAIMKFAHLVQNGPTSAEYLNDDFAAVFSIISFFFAVTGLIVGIRKEKSDESKAFHYLTLALGIVSFFCILAIAIFNSESVSNHMGYFIVMWLLNIIAVSCSVGMVYKRKNTMKIYVGAHYSQN